MSVNQNENHDVPSHNNEKGRVFRIGFLVLIGITLLSTFSIHSVLGAPWSPYLPKGYVNVELKYPGSKSYYDVILSEVPGGYAVSDGTYFGWCCDSKMIIEGHMPFKMTLISSLNETLPVHLNQSDWHRINYILNHKHPAATWEDIQTAIWFFTDDSPDYKFGDPSTRAYARAMIDDAKANGGDFIPGPGQILAIICDYGDNDANGICDRQIVIIEIDPPPFFHVPEVPYGALPAIIAMFSVIAVKAGKKIF